MKIIFILYSVKNEHFMYIFTGIHRIKQNLVYDKLKLKCLLHKNGPH